jgi:hypothetical protein
MGRGVVVKRNKLLEQLRELGARQPTVVVGVIGSKAAEAHKGEHGHSEATVAEVATWNHFGTSTIPARPAITTALTQHGDELRKLQTRIAGGIVEGKLTIQQGLGLLGEAAVGFIKQTIADGVPPPNAESTIEAKGSATPLIDKGQFRGSISYEVRNGEDGH